MKSGMFRELVVGCASKAEFVAAVALWLPPDAGIGGLKRDF
jgi:hypothetical protein